MKVTKEIERMTNIIHEFFLKELNLLLLIEEAKIDTLLCLTNATNISFLIDYNEI